MLKTHYTISKKTLEKVIECLNDNMFILDDDGCDEINDYDVIEASEELEKEISIQDKECA